MTERNEYDLGATRLKHAFDGVYHWYGTTREAVIVQGFGGVVERLRNAYFHDFPGINRYKLLNPIKPAWMERINLDGSIEVFYAVATNNVDTPPEWTRVSLTESTRTALFHNVEITGNVDITGKVTHTGNTEQIGNYDLKGDFTQTGDASITGDVEVIGNTDITGKLSSTDQYTNTVPDGTTPMLVTSKTEVTNLNAEFVQGYEPSETPVEGKLMVYGAGGSVPGESTDAATLEGHAASFFMPSAPDATLTMTDVDAGENTLNILTGLDVIPRLILIQYTPSGASAPTQTFAPSSDRAGIGAVVTYPDATHISVFVCSSGIGIKADGTTATINGTYTILLWK